MLGRVQRVRRYQPETQVARISNSGSAISKKLDARPCLRSNNEKAMLKGPVKIWYWLGVLMHARG